MNQQPTKRRNPFEKPISSIIQESNENETVKNVQETAEQQVEVIEQPIIEENEPQVQQIHQQQPVYQPQYQPQYTQQPVYYQQPVQQRAPKAVKRETKNYYAAQAVDTREKFTSTMEQSLRRRIQIVCAQRGIMFAQLVEDACREKLDREGIK